MKYRLLALFAVVMALTVVVVDSSFVTPNLRILPVIIIFDQPTDTPLRHTHLEQLVHGLDQFRCTPAAPCHIPVPHEQDTRSRLVLSFARLLDTMHAEVVQHEMPKRIRLDTQLVFPVADAIAEVDPRRFSAYDQNRGMYDGIFSNLREMAGCDMRRADGPCAASNAIHPYVARHDMGGGMAPTAKWITQYPWLGEFVRVQDDALGGVRRERGMQQQYPMFMKWLGNQERPAYGSRRHQHQERPAYGSRRHQYHRGSMHGM